ncbi:DUF1566 domain-containing protein [Salibacter halophilus]|uniref:DUF1566 domain-containing protein n=1 Tax=Salibacter halophilus TaxID=1803916 RepID=A0A6N6M799_9FLAO|nr:DUF1566 domain-containing protein [Salibacter halophilus]KAB1065678.1 DUF1566 domain-containing protein [Salibacter halophilus]
MNNIMTTLVVFFMTVSVLIPQMVNAQSPEKMSYQAVIRDGSDDLVTSTVVGMQISILQGSPNGTAVYEETQTPTTNTNGLVSLEIGTGTVVSGDFSTIDWANGPFFIKTETDPNGGTNYSITGTSQLLSVPYALHSTTADSLTGAVTYSEADPVFDTSLASSITGADTANWNSPHIDSTDISQMGYVAGLKTYEVGDFAQGGIVFWVDETGQHGLVCTIEDVTSSTIRWYAGSYGITRAVGDGVYGGEDNTNLIINAQMVLGDDGNDYAASVCSDLVVTHGGVDYGDWYLPTVEELLMIGQNRVIVNDSSIANGGTALVTSPYWSSNEVNANDAKYVLITPGGTSTSNTNKTAPFNVRAVREF